MREEILTLVYDHNTAKITLSGSEEHFSAGGFAVLRTRQLVLEPGRMPVWPDLLKALTELYETDRFRIDFHGPRSDFEAMRAACAHDEALELYYEGVPADTLQTIQYRTERIRSMYFGINPYHYSCLDRMILLDPFQELVNDHLADGLRQPGRRWQKLVDSVLENGHTCIEESQSAYDSEQWRQEYTRDVFGRRLDELHDIAVRLHPVSLSGINFMDQRKPLRVCCNALQKLKDSMDASANMLPDDCFDKMQKQYYTVIRICELLIKKKADLFVQKTNKNIRELHGREIWKSTSDLQDYPRLDLFTAGPVQWAPALPAEAVSAAQQIEYLHGYTQSLLEAVYKQYLDHFAEVWQQLQQTNVHNTQYLSGECDVLRIVVQNSPRQKLQKQIHLEEERKQIEAATRFMEELTILLRGHI